MFRPLAGMQDQVSITLLFLAWVIGWVSLSLIFSRLSGWTTLVQMYPRGPAEDGQHWRFQSAVFRHHFYYRAVLTINADQQGTTFSPLFLFRIGTAPFSVPWNEISSRETKWGVFTRAVELRFKRTPGIPVLVSPRLAHKLEEPSAGQWRYETTIGEKPNK